MKLLNNLEDFIFLCTKVEYFLTSWNFVIHDITRLVGN